MTKEKRDLLIHYDEDSQEIILYSVKTSETLTIRAKEFGGVRPEVDHFKSVSPEEAEMQLGGLVFSLLDLCSLKKIEIRPYEAEAEEAHGKFVEELEEQVKANDPDAQNQLSMHLHSRAMKNCSLPDLERAESLLHAAVAQGHKEATSRLESWPMLRSAAEHRIKRGPSA